MWKVTVTLNFTGVDENVPAKLTVSLLSAFRSSANSLNPAVSAVKSASAVLCKLTDAASAIVLPDEATLSFPLVNDCRSSVC